MNCVFDQHALILSGTPCLHKWTLENCKKEQLDKTVEAKHLKKEKALRTRAEPSLAEEDRIA